MTRTSQQIRREFIQFFQERGHTFVPSSSLLPADDPTLLFANAGMNQFKDVFLGTGARPYKRAVNSQKCLRAGGKHNDLEDVGHDTCHQTFFEMLGNWSFGDYFKAEAIAWAWELLTRVWELPKEELWATVFAGDAACGLAPDEESIALWPKVAGLDPGRIFRGSVDENFWEMGDTGPCGPCTEIHIDLGPERCDGSGHPGVPCRVNAPHCGRFIELWNLVFIQFHRDQTGRLLPLPARHVDTGMGFERVCAVLQGKTSNYDTDVFGPLMEWVENKTGLRYTGRVGQGADTDVAFRVIADHARACAFAIADGVLPSNEGRGYVVRRILRRAARFGRKLNLHEPFLHEMVALVARQMGEVFPEIRQRQDQVARTIWSEEEAFNRTLDRGLEEFRSELYWLIPFYITEQRRGATADYSDSGDLIVTTPSGPGKAETFRIERDGNVTTLFERLRLKRPQLTGATAFRLYATYGFPIDLTQLMAAERGLTVDMEGYQREMERHREISSAGGEPFQAAVITGLPETDDSAKYADAPIRARVFGWVTADGFVGEGKLAPGTETAVVLERTNFYGESGGQVGDCGVLRADDGSEFAVRRTRLFGHCVLHFGKMEKGSLTRAQTVTAEVDPSRFDTMRNHTATHLLNWALRKVLGGHVEQAGSVVEPERLRFDFTHGQAVTDEQLAQVERLVNQRILADEPVSALVLPLEQARRIPGVRAVFGEKYPDPVRVVCVGTTDPLRQAGEDTPVEFCGGTHLQRTAQAGFFKIVSEESVARGVRRITAVTGRGALEHLQRLDQAARAVAGALRVPVEEAPQRVAALLGEVRQLRKQSAAGALGGLEEALAAAHTVGGVKVIVCELPIESVEQMRSAVDQLRQKAAGPAAVLVGSRQGGKLTLVAGLSEDLVRSASLKATDWVKAAAGAVGGSGGGKATMAQAGGKDPDRLPQALQAAAEWVKTRLAGGGRR